MEYIYATGQMNFYLSQKGREKLEREMGHSCLNGMFLDELPLDAGRKSDEISQDCGIMCYLALDELKENKDE